MNRAVSAPPNSIWARWWNPGEDALVRGLFARALGVIYFGAFVSFAAQGLGLVGARGILPAQDFLDAVRNAVGAMGLYYVPTVFWLNASDPALQLVPWLGALLAVPVIFGFSSPLLFAALYALYLSLVSAGQDFMAFQWDNLLLEAGFLAIFLATPGPLIGWLYRLLVFKLFFMSAAVKLMSGDPNWRNLTALEYHYWTQPIPNGISWYAAQLPAWFQRLSVALLLVIEGILPWLIFTTRRLRAAAGVGLIFLQLLILLTGNYTFFNWLAIALAWFCFDDALLRRVIPGRGALLLGLPFARLKARRWLTLLLAAAAVLVVFVDVFEILQVFAPAPRLAQVVAGVVQPFRLVNPYGLFAIMTTDRPEIIVEGSNDGETWSAYEFKYKAGDVNRMPPFVAPHQPRLDWQLWFEALNAEQGAGPDQWFGYLLVRLLQGSPEVLALLDKNPFPNAPPRLIRARLEQYRFTDLTTRAQTGAWWTRTPQGMFVSPISLR